MSEASDYVEAAQLIGRMWFALDQRRYEDIYGMLTADARWNRDGAWQAGEAAIAASLNRRPLDLFSRHVMSNLVVDSRDGRLECEYYITAYAAQGAEPTAGPRPTQAPVVLADVTTVCVRQDGVLKIAEINPDMVFAREVPRN